jgi:hypothetical protein
MSLQRMSLVSTIIGHFPENHLKFGKKRIWQILKGEAVEPHYRHLPLTKHGHCEGRFSVSRSTPELNGIAMTILQTAQAILHQTRAGLSICICSSSHRNCRQTANCKQMAMILQTLKTLLSPHTSGKPNEH